MSREKNLLKDCRINTREHFFAHPAKPKMVNKLELMKRCQSAVLLIN